MEQLMFACDKHKVLNSFLHGITPLCFCSVATPFRRRLLHLPDNVRRVCLFWFPARNSAFGKFPPGKRWDARKALKNSPTPSLAAGWMASPLKWPADQPWSRQKVDEKTYAKQNHQVEISMGKSHSHSSTLPFCPSLDNWLIELEHKEFKQRTFVWHMENFWQQTQ